MRNEEELVTLSLLPVLVTIIEYEPLGTLFGTVNLSSVVLTKWLDMYIKFQ